MALDAIGIAAQHQRAIPQKREDVVRDAVVVGEQVSLRVAGFGKINLVEVAEAEPLAVQLDGDVFGAALEQFRLDVRFCFQNPPYQFRCMHDGGGG